MIGFAINFFALFSDNPMFLIITKISYKIILILIIESKIFESIILLFKSKSK
jgi:hypothetical protein